MKYSAAFVFAVASAACLAASDTPRPEDFLAAEPSLQSVSETRPMPPDYDILLVKSIFTNKKHRGVAGPGSPRPGGGFVLRGVIRQADRFTAYVEDTSSRRVYSLRPGDAICGGKLTRISLRGAEYEAAGRRAAVTIGDRLDGGTAEATASAH